MVVPQFIGVAVATSRSRNRAASTAAIVAGFGVSEMFAETRLEFELSSYVECLLDWEWSTEEKSAPDWYLNGKNNAG
jgi:hypothetical protein